MEKCGSDRIKLIDRIETLSKLVASPNRMGKHPMHMLENIGRAPNIQHVVKRSMFGEWDKTIEELLDFQSIEHCYIDKDFNTMLADGGASVWKDRA